MIRVVSPVRPDRANHTQRPKPEGSEPVAEMEDVISP